MTSIQKLQNKCIFIFDLEFIGQVQDISTCHIWEIAVYCIGSGRMFEAVVDPDPTLLVFEAPPIPELPHLTRKFLNEEKAQTFDIVLANLICWVQLQTNQLPVFISHNTFKADKPILELEAARHLMHIPLNWFFFDSLHFCRDYYKSDDGNFSLSGLNRQLFNCEIVEAHRARNDVVACTDILAKITENNWHLLGPIYGAYTTSLRTIRWIGKKAEALLIECNICSVENLLSLLKQNSTADYINHCMSSCDSIRKTMYNLLHPNLPKENINNIVNVLVTTVFLPYILHSKVKITQL